ncbi:MAG TPA: hypothetical protein VF276_04890 [Chloroflexia bacterium]
MNVSIIFGNKAVRATLAGVLAGLAILAPGSGAVGRATPRIDPPNATAYSYYYHYAWYDHPEPPSAAPMNLGDPLIGPGIPMDQDLRALV